MKEEKDLVVIACRLMAGVSPAAALSPATQPLPTASPVIQPVSTPSPSTQLFPTPSPFSFSVATTGWSSRPSVYFSHCFLRSLALLFSFVSALSLTVTAPSSGRAGFTKYPELTYCLVVTILALTYSAFQLCKGVCDITHKGFLISDRVSDYSSFILDQLVGYLLASSSSVIIPAIQRLEQTALWKAGIVSVCMSFAAFLVTAICALFSGYKLCKRVIW
ncbi:CASP-like protein 4A4 [Vitis vinifera]|uniref:CASP-like protein n=2 Tax=Vitis vinifera TaxID=29760 RepID=D7TW55_VITVI|eukprot:XP_002276504.1 PREDICTED: CASP-like protein 4A4 [Vitis vinifera]